MYKRIKSPVNVQVEVTGSCTHVCEHCYNHWRPKDVNSKCESKSLNLSQIDQILEQLRIAEVFDITITGGEPLMNYKSLLHLARGARDLGVRIGLNSNLVLLSEDHARELKSVGINHILTSILGPTPEIHDQLANLPGAFEKLQKGIRNATDAGIRVTANMVVTKLNYLHVRETGIVASRMGAGKFTGTKAGCPGNCSDFSELALSRVELNSFMNNMCLLAREDGVSVDTLEPIPLCAMSNVSDPTLFMNRRCSAGITVMTIGSDGGIRPCSHFNLCFGNIFVDGIFSAWEKMSSFAKGVQIPDVCSNCKLLELCGAGCRMEGMMSGKRLNSADPYIEPENIDRVFDLLVKGRVKKSVSVSKNTMFVLKQFKIRKEDFGGIVSVGSTRKTFLNHAGFRIFEQLKPGTHSVENLDIDWGNTNPEQFISGLIERNVVSCSSS